MKRGPVSGRPEARSAGRSREVGASGLAHLTRQFEAPARVFERGCWFGRSKGRSGAVRDLHNRLRRTMQGPKELFVKVLGRPWPLFPVGATSDSERTWSCLADTPKLQMYLGRVAFPKSGVQKGIGLRVLVVCRPSDLSHFATSESAQTHLPGSAEACPETWAEVAPNWSTSDSRPEQRSRVTSHAEGAGVWDVTESAAVALSKARRRRRQVVARAFGLRPGPKRGPGALGLDATPLPTLSTPHCARKKRPRRGSPPPACIETEPSAPFPLTRNLGLTTSRNGYVCVHDREVVFKYIGSAPS